MHNLAIIPGKHYSKRCPNKNTRNFLGRPIVEWTLEAAKESCCFDKIILIADIEEWKKYADDDKVLFIPNPMAEDHFTVAQVCEAALEIVFLFESDKISSFCCLLPTAPMRNSGDIISAWNIFESNDNGYDSVMAVTNFVQPWWQALCFGSDSCMPVYSHLFDYREENVLELVGKRVIDNGSMYWCSTDAFLKKAYKTLCPGRLGVYFMPYERSIDIDTDTDFKIAEFLAGGQKKL